MTKSEWRAMLREDTWSWRPFITRDDLALIGVTVIVFTLLEGLRWLLR